MRIRRASSKRCRFSSRSANTSSVAKWDCSAGSPDSKVAGIAVFSTHGRIKLPVSDRRKSAATSVSDFPYVFLNAFACESP